MKQIMPRMNAADSGHLVNISSLVHCLFAPNLSEYSASKAALYNFHSSLRLGNKYLMKTKEIYLKKKS